MGTAAWPVGLVLVVNWVSLTIVKGRAEVVIAIDNDGPGVAADLRDQVLRRGVRADEAGPGSGFGLAIVRELAELYDGSITLSDTTLGGLRAELRLPHAADDGKSLDSRYLSRYRSRQAIATQTVRFC